MANNISFTPSVITIPLRFIQYRTIAVIIGPNPPKINPL